MYSRTSSLRFFVIIFLLPAAVSIQAQISNLSASVETPKVETKRNLRPPAENIEPKKNYTAVVAEIKRKLLLTPNDSMLYNNLGILYADLKLYEESLKALKRAIEINPKNAQFYYNLSIAYYYLKHPAESLDAIRHSVELNPQNVNANRLLCEFSLAANNFNEAAACYENLFRLSPAEAISYARYGFSLIHITQIKKAADFLEKAARLFPNEAAIHNSFGMALLRKKHHKKAVAAFKRALELDPEFIPARFNLVIAEIENNNKTAAIKQYFTIKNSDADLARQLYKLIYSDKIIFLEDIKNSKDNPNRP